MATLLPAKANRWVRLPLPAIVECLGPQHSDMRAGTALQSGGFKFFFDHCVVQGRNEYIWICCQEIEPSATFLIPFSEAKRYYEKDFVFCQGVSDLYT